MPTKLNDVKATDLEEQRMTVLIPYLLLFTDFYEKRDQNDLKSVYYADKENEASLNVF